MRLTSRAIVLGVAALTIGVGACFASAPTGLHRETDESDGGEGGSFNLPDAHQDPIPDAGVDPHAVVGTDPSHGPFSGGQRVLINGRGFGSKLHVWFGATEIDASAVLPIDPTRVQVAAPPSIAGSVDVTVENDDDGSTKRTLMGGYTYDAIYAVPNEGPTSGGTILQVFGQGTHFGATTTAAVDGKPCTALAVKSATELTCQTPSDTPGSKTVSVTTGSEVIVVLDAFLYADSDNGYRGGLSGDPLAGHMKVLVYDNYTGDPIPAANVILGAPIASAIVAQTDMNGIALINDASLTGTVTLTVAGSCHSPQTFAAVPVDTATLYLDPVLTPACASSGDPPPVGGNNEPTGTVTGELVWPMTDEFKRGPWSTVPAPLADEKQIAFVVAPAYAPTQPFYQPDDSEGVTPESPGMTGYDFTFTTLTGTVSLYALAGIENTSTGQFTAYAMGVVRGVPIHPNQTTPNVYISMDRTLDQLVTLDVTGPTPGPKGPDRLQASVAIVLGSDGYLVFPAGTKTPLLPFDGKLPFVGLPGLAGTLTGAQYVTVANGVTGPSAGTPTSVIAALLTSSASTPVKVGGFVGVPTLTAPAIGAKWDGQHLATSFESGSAPIDITVFDAVAGNGIAHWLVASPGGTGSVLLPDLSTFPGCALPAGPLTIEVIGGVVDGFDYANFIYRDLRTYGMSAYAHDYFSSHD